MKPKLTKEDVVAYRHPAWGPVQGRVLEEPRVDGTVLVLDLHPDGARELWPVDEVEIITHIEEQH